MDDLYLCKKARSIIYKTIVMMCPVNDFLSAGSGAVSFGPYYHSGAVGRLPFTETSGNRGNIEP